MNKIFKIFMQLCTVHMKTWTMNGYSGNELGKHNFVALS